MAADIIDLLPDEDALSAELWARLTADDDTDGTTPTAATAVTVSATATATPALHPAPTLPMPDTRAAQRVALVAQLAAFDLVDAPTVTVAVPRQLISDPRCPLV